MSGANASPIGRSHKNMSGANASPIGRSHKSMRSSVLTMTLIGALLCMSVLILAAPPSNSPVADAAARGDKDAVRGLLQKGADVNAAQSDGMTALHWAAYKGDAELADMLLYA